VLVRLADVPGGEHGALHHEHVGAGFLDDRSPALRVCGHRRDGACHARAGDLLDPLADEPVLHRRHVDLLQECVDLVHRRLCDGREDLGRILVARLHAVEVEHGESAEVSHLRGEAGVHDAVHGGGEEGDLQAGAVDREGHVDFRGVHGHPTRDQGNLVEPIRAPGPFASAQLELHLEILQE
jgi:hypothetical protein